MTTSREDALLDIAAVEKALAEGYPPPGVIVQGQNNIKTAVRVASERLNISANTFRSRIGTQDVPGIYQRLYGLQVDWSKYRAISVAYSPQTDQTQEPRTDPIETLRLRDDVSRLRNEVRELSRRLIEAQDIRAGVLGLTKEPLTPKLIIPSNEKHHSGSRAVVLHLSDIQYGETIRADEMDGLNRYDSVLAQVRLGRFFSIAADLMTNHWKGEPPSEIVLCLGGDLISGSIHPELEITDYPTVPIAVREVGEHIAGGIVLLRKIVEVPIRIYSVPGNHGRSTMKPQSKRRSSSSFDMLATDFSEAIVKGSGVDNIAFYRTFSPDAYFSTYGWHWMLTHGDTMGGRGGGTGFIGPMAAIIKGHRKLVDTSWRAGRAVHFVLTGHYHTTGKTAFGWANGSVAGYNEFARDLRADPEPARQNMLVVHPKRGVIIERPIYLGAPEEGSLYAGPATVIRPTWSEDLGEAV